MADNELIFTNPYKMKMSIVLGVMQMLFGPVIVSIINYVKAGHPVCVCVCMCLCVCVYV